MEKSIQELMGELTDRLIIHIEGNEEICPTCHGLRFIFKQEGDRGYIANCLDCYNGKVYICKFCGKKNKTDYCDCKEARAERDKEFNLRENKKDLERFQKAKKINFNDYNGFLFIPDNNERVYTVDEVYDWLCDRIKYDKLSDEDLPEFLWGASSEPVFGVNLEDIIYDKCEEGYEDMDSCLNFNSESFKKAQEYIDKWYKEQGNAVNIYYENYNIAVLLKDVIKEIREKIE